MQNNGLRKGLFICLCLLLAVGCSTYYQQNLEYQENIYAEDFKEANRILEKTRKKAGSRNALLFQLEKGYILSRLNFPDSANTYFLQADRTMDDAHTQTGSEILALVTNPMMKPYKAEEVEKILLHYYLALNFIKLNNFDAARVECRRIELTLQTLSDKYPNQHRYRCDAFAQMVSGLLYEAQGELNDAFISYRNAYECYQTVYVKTLGTPVPQQLKQDLLRTARLNGFYSEKEAYEKEWGIKENEISSKKAELILFWNNGLGPIKAENSILFTMLPGAGGIVNFTNEEYGMTFPFYLPQDPNEKVALSRVQVVRVAFPKYVARPARFSEACVRTDSGCISFELGEDVTAIAFKTLEDRMLRELGNALLRLAVKKGIEYGLREQDPTVGALAGIANAFTEKADTRNWQTLPGNIQYLRLPLDTGNHTLYFDKKGNGKVVTDTLFIHLKKNEIRFLDITTSEVQQPQAYPTW